MKGEVNSSRSEISRQCEIIFSVYIKFSIQLEMNILLELMVSVCDWPELNNTNQLAAAVYKVRTFTDSHFSLHNNISLQL